MTKRFTVFLALIGALLALLGATQVWFHFSIDPTQAAQDTLEVRGTEASVAIMPLVLAATAAAIALTLAGRVVRYLVSTVLVLLGAGIVWIALTLPRDPLAAATAQLSELTGITGGDQLNLVTAWSTTPWPWVAAVGGAGLVGIGVLTLLVSHRWVAANGRYEARRTAMERDVSEPESVSGATGTAPRDRVSDWDVLSAGDDPSEWDDLPDASGR